MALKDHKSSPGFSRTFENYAMTQSSERGFSSIKTDIRSQFGFMQLCISPSVSTVFYKTGHCVPRQKLSR